MLWSQTEYEEHPWWIAALEYAILLDEIQLYLVEPLDGIHVDVRSDLARDWKECITEGKDVDVSSTDYPLVIRCDLAAQFVRVRAVNTTLKIKEIKVSGTAIQGGNFY